MIEDNLEGRQGKAKQSFADGRYQAELGNEGATHEGAAINEVGQAIRNSMAWPH